MTDEELRIANIIKKEILDLEDFLHSAEKVWTGRVIKRTSQFLIKSSPYGIYNEAEYHMDTETKNKVLDVLKERLSDLRKQLGSI
nr:hypothetical protein [Candidatus Paenibacillus intestinavium]